MPFSVLIQGNKEGTFGYNFRCGNGLNPAVGENKKVVDGKLDTQLSCMYNTPGDYKPTLYLTHNGATQKAFMYVLVGGDPIKPNPILELNYFLGGVVIVILALLIWKLSGAQQSK